jgi:hypothetical protein
MACYRDRFLPFRWLNSADNLNSQPKKFWKYVAFFRKRNSTPIHFTGGKMKQTMTDLT